MLKNTGAAVSAPYILAVGRSKITSRTNLGSPTGAKPMKEAIVLLVSYFPSIGIEAVPVLPAILYPGILAHFASPLLTALTKISVIILAVAEDTGLPISFGGILVNFPFSSFTAATTCGSIIAPSFAIEENAVKSSIGVTEIPCPNPAVAKSASYHEFLGLIRGADSPSKSIPVCSPIPNLSKYLSILPTPSSWATYIIPVLSECWITSSIVEFG